MAGFKKKMEREKSLALEANNNIFDAKMSIPPSVKPELRWWLSKIDRASNPIRDPIFMKMLDSEPIYFNPNRFLLLSSSKQLHPLWRNTTLVEGICSGRR